MTKLFRELQSQAPSCNRPQSDTAQFIDQASKQQFGMNVPDFLRFAKMAEGTDMGAVVQELRQSGAIDDKTFSDLQNKANGFMSLVKMVTGK